MRRTMSLIGVVTLAVVAAGPAFASGVDPGLLDVLDMTPADQPVSTLVYLSDRVDLVALNARLDRILADRPLRHKVVVEALQEKAEFTQVELVAYLESRQQAGAIESFEAYWIANLIRVDAVAAEIFAIAQRDDVELVYYNYEIELIEPFEPIEPSQPSSPYEPEPGIKLIQADRVWNELGITGDGMLVASLDTGVDGHHPALEGRWRGLDPRYKDNPEWAWFDPVTNTTFPQAFGSHGTHTMGTVCGGPPGDEVGVAPGAQWIHAAVIDRVSIPKTVEDAIKSFQWMVDPDENPDTHWDVPDVCSNSWGLTTGHGFPPCDKTFWEFLDACEAVGTIILFSAGNEGHSQMRRPADRATTDYDTCAVGACDGNNPDCPIASFSSRGPTNCTPGGGPAIKPEITAPGVNVRSAMPGGGYGNKSGTSMASPHINGVVALMREANPDLSSEEIKQIMYDTAWDKGSPGNDNDYGWGLVNAFEAVIECMGNPEPYACCFKDGHCEDLLRSECIDLGGRSKFGQTCATYPCPQPGACCVTNAICEIMLELDCLMAGGDFIGEGVSCRRACPCHLIRKMKSKCSSGGTIKVKVKFVDDRRNGEYVEIGIGDRLRYDVLIEGKKAKLYTCCFNGPQEVKLLDPEDCEDPQIVNCPE